MKKIISILAVFMLVLSACASQSSKQKPLIVGMELAYPPFEGKDDKGKPDGVSVQFMKDFSKYLGRPIKVENVAWDGLIPSLQTGKIDMIMSSMTITKEREKTIDFSKPYAKAMLAILTNVNSNVNSIDDLNVAGKKVAVKTGSTGYFYAQKHLTNAEIVALPDESACVTEVSQGKADGFLYDQLTIYRNQQAHPDTTKAVFIPFQDAEYWGVAVKQGNRDLNKKLDQFITKYRKEGGFDKITEKYLASEKKAFDELGFTWFFEE